MKNGPDCIPCCLRRILRVSKLVTPDEWLHRKILDEAMQDLGRADELASPAEIVYAEFRRAAKTLGDPDPFAAEKRRWVEETVGNIELIRESIRAAPDPFKRAVEFALLANIFDSEFRDEIDPSFSLKALLRNEAPAALAASVAENLEDFRNAVERATRILFVHDSAAELVFDRLLIETAGKPPGAVVSVVREGAAFADATHDDARAVGLDLVATRVIDPGVPCLGLPLAICSQALRDEYQAADLVVAKGQAAWETLEGDNAEVDGVRRDVWFLLRTKCPLVARLLGVGVGDCVLEPS